MMHANVNMHVHTCHTPVHVICRLSNYKNNCFATDAFSLFNLCTWYLKCLPMYVELVILMQSSSKVILF